MAQPLTDFLHTFPGTVSRSADEIVLSMRNADTVPIPPGAPVFLKNDSNGPGVTLCRATSAAAQFVGVAVRIPSRAPEVYGTDTAVYAPGDAVDILARGAVSVELRNEPCSAGGKVHVTLETGAFTSAAEEGETIELTNCSWRSPSGSSEPTAELQIRTRNSM